LIADKAWGRDLLSPTSKPPLSHHSKIVRLAMLGAIP
jgi:hypothetical protein